MRFTKFMILAAVAIVATACAHSFEVSPTQEPAIDLGSWASNLTKARTQGSSGSFASGDNFAVYGYKYKAAVDETPASTVTVFDDVTVSTTDGTTWTYSPKRFWDTTFDSYTFFAVSPAATGTAATVNAQTGAITSESITFAGNDNDILVADKKTVNKTDGSGNFNSFGTVALAFNHIASLVDLQVKKHTNIGDDATVAVSSVSLVNINKTNAFSVSTAYTDNHPVVDWATGFTASGSNTGSYSNTSGVTSVTLPDDVTTTFTDNPLITSLIVMPQTFRTSGDYIQAVQITYSLAVTDGGTNTYTKTIPLADFDIVDDSDNEDTKVGQWKAGCHYTFNITIDAHAITFTASINTWDTEDTTGYYYLVN